MIKENFKLSIIITIVVITSLSATYAWLAISSVSNNSSTGTAGCFSVNYSGQEIDNSSLQSTEDYTQGAKSNIILSKNSNCEIYSKAEIMLHTNTTSTAPLSNGAMKYKVMQGTTEISTGAVAAVDANSTDQLLATVDLTTTNVTYTVYIWIDPTISQGTYHEKTYSGYLYARSTQSSSITE